MSQDSPIRNNPGPIAGVHAPSSAPQAKQTAAGGAVFRALLDELQEKAHKLREDGQAVTGPAELAGAVETARDTIAGALSLSDQLLEAYRAAQQQDQADDSGEPGGERHDS